MISFLDQVIKSVKKEKDILTNKMFILPNGYSCLYLRKKLLEECTKTQFAPNIISIESFIEDVANIEHMDNIRLLFEFYSLYIAHPQKDQKIDSFDLFLQWGPTAIKDFDQIDSHLIDPKSFFSSLSDIKRIDKWNIETPGKMVKSHFQFLKNLGTYYKLFTELLLNQKVAYRGLIYRKAAEKIESYIYNLKQEKEIILAGFNNLNAAEIKIFKALISSGKAQVFWDSDQEIINTSSNSNDFLKTYIEKISPLRERPFSWVQKKLKGEKHIEIIGAPKNISQFKLAGNILSKLDDYNDTAFILSDQSLLPLAINAIPPYREHCKSVKENINIAMGYPLKSLHIYGLFDLLFILYTNAQKVGAHDKSQFYHKDVIQVLNHPYISILLNSKDSNIAYNLISFINEYNTIFINFEILFSSLKNHLEKEQLSSIKFLFENIQSASHFLVIALRVCSLLKNKLDRSIKNNLDLEYVHKFYNVFQQLQNLNSHFGHIKSLKSLYIFYKEITSQEKLTFQGDSLQGLQVMEILQTQALDFSTVIMTSVNEGVLPKGKNESSFIPNEIKDHYSLPSYRDLDASFSYHFYRLLQRAKRVYLLYNTEITDNNKGEKSRFLTQIQLSQPSIKTFVSSPNIINIPKEPRFIKKTDQIMEKLREIANNGISPSALEMYLRNPIDFYKRKILGINEDYIQVEETIDAKTLGNVVHDVLEILFNKPELKLRNLLIEDIDFMFTKIETHTKKAFEEHYKNGQISKGENRLIYEVCKNLIFRFIELQKKEVKTGKSIKIIATEQFVEKELFIKGLSFPVKLKGFIDRVDLIDGVFRVIDYKTGLVTRNNLWLSQIELICELKYSKALQVMMYTYLFFNHINTNFESPIEGGVYSFKNMNNNFLRINFSSESNEKKADYNITQERIDKFVEELKKLILEIYNPDIPFQEK